MNDFHIKLSFRKKLLLSFIVLSFIPVLLIGITTYRLYNRFIHCPCQPETPDPQVLLR